ncbi:MAG: hypothetical protein HY785_02350 [Oscillatoriophycideae cyanobacterium NC_groundwater_1537_Pr4_S-0.65um_50_18]|nr:hypothetical protein [Oscillatoriophycideae cyanobacterium NC_groundwater_1537_Pr4_S-0.65um_50_18]
MNVESSQKPITLPVQSPVSQNSFDFDSWATEVRRQMVASLKRRTVIYGDFWGNEARAANAKAAEAKVKPEV